MLPLIQGANFKPLVETLFNFSQKLYWILPVAKNKRKLYEADADDEQSKIEEAMKNNEMNSDTDLQTLNDIRTQETAIMHTYNSNEVTDEENKYTYLLKALNPLFTPFTDPDYQDFNIVSKTVRTNITAILDNLDNFYASVVAKDLFTRRRFVLQEYNLGLTKLETTRIKGGEIVI